MHPTTRSSRRGFFPLTIVSALLIGIASVMLLGGCATDEDLMTSAAPPRGDSSPPAPTAPDGAVPTLPDISDIDVTPEQLQYLEALTTAGVRRSSDLTALSIGSYVCQGRAAGQTDQGVWDFVFPLVRGEIYDMNPNSATEMAAEVHETTAQYIRIATDRLC